MKLNDIQERWLKDTVRNAYDTGYSDARNSKAVPGDSAPGYRGRDIESELGDHCIALLDCAPIAPDASISKKMPGTRFWQLLAAPSWLPLLLTVFILVALTLGLVYILGTGLLQQLKNLT